MNTRFKTRPTSPRTKPKTLLLVDDDPGVREMVGRVLTSEGYLVICATNGAEALGIAAANPIDLALLDLNMPVKGGWDTYEQLTTQDPMLPVIIITARPNQLFTSMAAGVGALLEKPLDFPVVLRTVETLLAESAELRLARMTGQHTEFHYRQSPKDK